MSYDDSGDDDDDNNDGNDAGDGNDDSDDADKNKGMMMMMTEKTFLMQTLPFLVIAEDSARS